MEYCSPFYPYQVLDYFISKHDSQLADEVKLATSKSESNRVLLINALSGGKVSLKNLSDARDTQTMKYLLRVNPKEWDVIDAGTTMRFLTAYLAVFGNEKVITGSQRMKERPIAILVEALQKIGAEIQYLENKGYPPLKISSFKNQCEKKIYLPGNVSSQYISALLMIAPCLPKGLQVELTTTVFSKPYIAMTLDLMQSFGIDHTWMGDRISIEKGEYQANEYTIEGDWSAASYWYAFVALSQHKRSSLSLPSLRTGSSQGDSRVAEIMSPLGIKTEFLNDKIRLTKKETEADHLTLDMRDCPDLAQTIMVVATAKGIKIDFTGLESLKLKETDRIEAMRNELSKIGAELRETPRGWHMAPSQLLPKSIQIDTYEDHRMAMAFAPLCQLLDVIIKHPDVVSKSYPGFWKEVKKIGVKISPC